MVTRPLLLAAAVLSAFLLGLALRRPCPEAAEWRGDWREWERVDAV